MVVYDKELQMEKSNFVLLFHLKQEKILKYDKAIVRTNLRTIDKEEISVADYALKRYFKTLKEYNTENYNNTKEIKDRLYALTKPPERDKEQEALIEEIVQSYWNRVETYATIEEDGWPDEESKHFEL